MGIKFRRTAGQVQLRYRTGTKKGKDVIHGFFDIISLRFGPAFTWQCKQL